MHAFSCSLVTDLSWKQCLPVLNSIYSVSKILSLHKWVTLGIALFTTQSWAITSVSGKA